MAGRKKKMFPKSGSTEDDSDPDYEPMPRKEKARQKAQKKKLQPYIKILNVLPIKEAHRQFHVGKVFVGTTNKVPPETWNKCEARFLPLSLVLQFDDSEKIVVKFLADYSKFIVDLVDSNLFSIGCKVEDNRIFFFDVYFVQLPMTKFNVKFSSCIQTLFGLMYNVWTEDYEESEEPQRVKIMESLADLYTNIRKERECSIILGNEIVHHQLKLKLGQYQKDSIQWMIYKEKQTLESKAVPHPLYIPITLKSGLEVYYDKYSGHVETEKILIDGVTRGGILADEPGLGKTVEVLACILLHPKVSEDEPDPSILPIGNANATARRISKKMSPRKRNVTEEEENKENDPRKDIIGQNKLNAQTQNQVKVTVKHGSGIKMPPKKRKWIEEKNKENDHRKDVIGQNKLQTLKEHVEKSDAKKSQVEVTVKHGSGTKMSRKRKLTQEEEDKENDHRKDVIGQNKLKVLKEHVEKSNAKKNQVEVAVKQSSGELLEAKVTLDMGHSSCLQDVNVRRSSRVSGPFVECTCGMPSEAGTINCTDCGKIQHAICMNYKKSYGAYRCPQCWINQPLLDCKATLIVCPDSLKKRWQKEIRKHILDPFNVLVYRDHNSTPVYPTELRNYHVVLTTYSTLEAEINGNAESFCPLTQMKWWRICIDEAHKLKKTTSKIAIIAQRLNAQFRWAITGTPISKNISDLYGLISYLQIEPYRDFMTWKNILLDPYMKGKVKPMHKFLSQIMWRTCRNGESLL